MTADTVLLLVTAAVAFAAGVVVGILSRVLLDRTRKGDPMQLNLARILLLLPESYRRITGRGSRVIGLGLVVLALAANAIVGFLTLSTRSDLVDLVECVEDYNRAEGEAREAREEALRSTTNREEELWRNLESRLARASSTTEDVVDEIRDYRSELAADRNTRVLNPYPDPDVCRRLDP